MTHQQMTMERKCIFNPIFVRALSNMPYAQASVLEQEGKLELISYATKVAEIRWGANGAWLRVYGLYSATTRRHISAFMREYGMGNGYEVARKCAEMGHWYNLETGEVVEDLEVLA